MIARIAKLVLALAAIALAGAGGILVLAHRQIRAIDPPLPRLADLQIFAAAADLPVRVSVWNTASQPARRSSVLEPSRDPDPRQPYVMSHPSFVVEWSDGRTLLVDAGMDPEQARAFGRPLEWLGGGAIEPHGGVAERIASALAGRPAAIAFTHLHTDHVGGVVSLCRALGSGRLRLLQTNAQAEVVNHTTRPGRALLDDARCLTRERTGERPVAALAGLPGAFVVHAAGHTPGSQIIGAFVRDAGGVRGHPFAGDAANAIDGIRRDVPKPWAYQIFVVPENEARLARVRAWLREAEAAGFVVAIAHDERHLATTGIPPFDATP